jgi:DNA-binding CsgD family transcriptional regulator
VRPIPTVGHADDLAEIARAWRQVAGGQPVCAVITGPAGIGKSRLVSTAITALDPPRVLSGAARVHSPAPYDWLAAVLATVDTAGIGVPRDALAWLAQDPDVPRERYAPDALLRIAVRVVRALVAAPAVLVVEDLHALDPASLNLVAALAASPGLPALLLVTSRPPAEAQSPVLVAATLARLAGTPGAVRQDLRPLGVDDVASLLAEAYPERRFSPHVVERVTARTGGNPYQLTEMLGRRAPRPRPAADVALTDRERDVLARLALGRSNQQIAHELTISVRTVAVHVSNVLRKTGSASRTDAALWAVNAR